MHRRHGPCWTSSEHDPQRSGEYTSANQGRVVNVREYVVNFREVW